jgi:hypothetical protein
MGWFGWAAAGFFGGGILVFAIGMALPSIIRISQSEGSYAMGVAFFWTPLGAVLGAVIAGYLGSGRG